jgi:3-isopropylmalate dehydrogenase
MRAYKIAVIPGDGIGPEIMEATIKVLESLDIDFDFVHCEAGYEYWKRSGRQITQETIDVIKECDSCLKGPTATPPGPGTYKSVAVTLRQKLDLYANVRPFKSRRGVKSLHDNVDFVLVRENTEDLYKGIEYRVGDSALGMRVITRRCCERIAKFAFELARRERRKKVTAVHKATILKETCGLFRDVCFDVSKSYPDITFDDTLVDTAALKLVRSPEEFDVMVTTNIFGDILSDEAAAITGGLGLAPGANIGDEYSMFEPVHGTVYHKAGKGVVNPCALMFSSAMMLRHLGEEDSARKLEVAIERVLEEGKQVTYDLGGSASTMEMAEAIITSLESS